MRFGVSIATNIASSDLGVHAESLGFHSFWGTDSQMLWSDVYSYLALVASKTERIELGPAVAVAPTRLAPVTAQSIATINRLAPGRVRLAIGTAHTAMRTMGMKPMTVAAFGEYLRVVRALLTEGETEYELNGVVRPIRFLQPEFDAIARTPAIPIYVAATGPRTQRLAGEYGEGLIGATLATTMPQCRLNVVAGASEVQREVPADYRYLHLGTVAVLAPGEAIDSDAIIDLVGPQVLGMYHSAWDAYVLDPAGYEPPPHLADRWDAYLANIEARGISPDRRYLSVHDYHGTSVPAIEREFVTVDVIRAVAIVGEADEVIARIKQIETAGVTDLILRLGYVGADVAMARFAGEVVPAFR